MRSDLGTIIWIVVLVLLLTGAISLGDIFSLIFSTIGFIILVALVASLVFRHRIRRAMNEANERGEEFKGYTWNFGGYQNTSRPRNPNEGRVSVKSVPNTQKRVSEDVGEYVDFKEE